MGSTWQNQEELRGLALSSLVSRRCTPRATHLLSALQLTEASIPLDCSRATMDPIALPAPLPLHSPHTPHSSHAVAAFPHASPSAPHALGRAFSYSAAASAPVPSSPHPSIEASPPSTGGGGGGSSLTPGEGSTLTSDELDSLRRSLGSTCSVVCAGVAKLYVCRAESVASGGGVGRSWQWSGEWGALALIVDRAPPAASKHLSLFRLHDCSLAARLQLYEGMEYRSAHRLFHTVEVAGGHVGFSFASADEAQEMISKVRAHVPPPGSVADKLVTPKRQGSPSISAAPAVMKTVNACLCS